MKKKTHPQKTNQKAYQKALIEKFVREEYSKKFKKTGRVSIRQRHKFMESLRKKVSKRFGKDILCLVNFNEQGLVTLIASPETQSTPKGQIYQSFVHPPIFYTTHCLDRFSERAESHDSRIIELDQVLHSALLSFGIHDDYLVSPQGLLAYEIEDDRMIIKTFISYDLLSDKQIRDYYGVDVLSVLMKDLVAKKPQQSDFIVMDEIPELPDKETNPEN